MVKKKNEEATTQANNQVPLLAKLVYGQYSEEKTALKRVLNHDEGVGSPCSNCDKCEGLDLHFWRKVCKSCGCRFEEHDVQVANNYEEVVYSLLKDDDSELLSSIEYDSEDEKHPLVLEFTPSKKEPTPAKIGTGSLKPPEESTLAVNESSSLVKRRRRSHAKSLKRRRSKAVSQHMKTAAKTANDEKHSDETDEIDVKAEQLRQRDMVRQIPPHDFDANYSRNFDEFEKEELRLFLALVQDEAIGQATQNKHTGKQHMNCSFCHLTIPTQQTYVTAGRITSKQWHESCFKCSRCQEALVDDLYFAYEGSIYCGRHFGEQIKFRCQACDELIFSRQYCKADHHTWHVKHFCCFQCDSQLGGSDYVTVKEQPYCLCCYKENLTQLCQSCGKSIELDGELLEYEHMTWHNSADCFSCHVCHKCLIDLNFVVDDNTLYCTHLCWSNRAKEATAMTSYT